jgi:hypothetical protein
VIVTVETLTPVQGPARIGQATAVEQSRAVAEVAAAVQVAQACPRDLGYAVDEMRRSCQQARLAERAFFRYSRGDGPVTGPSIHLARELARCWGNVQYGVHELRRDDEHGQSEMQAWAWDVQTNSRASTTFIVPHARDTRRGRRELTDLRDIYENNANNAARRLREMILGLLPQWYVEEAKDLCTGTIERGGGKPLAQRVADSLKAFAELGITQDRIERKIGHPSSAWTPQDLATLSVVYTSIKRGEVRIEDEFDLSAVSVADVTPAAAPAPSPAEQAVQPERGGGLVDPDVVVHQPIDERQWRAINERFREMGVNGTGQARARLVILWAIVDRPELAKGSDLTAAEAQLVLDNLAGDAGIKLVVDVLTKDGAPAHLIPATAPQSDEEPDPAEPTAGDVARAELEQMADEMVAGDRPDPGATSADDVDPIVEAGFSSDQPTGEWPAEEPEGWR